MKTEEDLKAKIETLKAMGSPSALSKARELEWALGTEEEPDVESDMIVDALMKNLEPTETDLWNQLPEFTRNDQLLYTINDGTTPVQKPKDWDDTTHGQWNEKIAASIKKEERERGKAFSWRELLGADAFVEMSKKLKKRKNVSDDEAYQVGFYTKIPDEAASIETAELIVSKTKRGTHRPLLDIDFPAVVIPSTTPGHGHLYIDKEMSWKDYKKLLNLFADLGIIEHGYRGASLARGYSALRVPWVKKDVSKKDIVKTFS